MSEYQYYEFRAIDRPLDRTAQEALRSISSRARITATSFVNRYGWGDLKGDPRKFMEQWFDLHLYLANWGTRRLMMRVPKRFLDPADIDPFLCEVDWVGVWASGENMIVDILREEVDAGDDCDEDLEWLATLTPLRADVLSGDFRLFYLLWLAVVQEGLVADDQIEPLPGIGPLTGALASFAEFFGIDPNLVQAAAEQGTGDAATCKDDLRQILEGISKREKTELLSRVVDGDLHVAAELRRRFRKHRRALAVPRTAEILRARAREIGEACDRAEAERREAERRGRANEAEKARRARLKALKQRGSGVWREVEEEIERRNALSYDRAANLLSDLQALALVEQSQAEFSRRLVSIRLRHEKKGKFMERLTRLGLDDSNASLSGA